MPFNVKEIRKIMKSRATSAHKKHVATCMNIISPVNFKLIGVVVISAIVEGTAFIPFLQAGLICQQEFN